MNMMKKIFNSYEMNNKCNICKNDPCDCNQDYSDNHCYCGDGILSDSEFEAYHEKTLNYYDSSHNYCGDDRGLSRDELEAKLEDELEAEANENESYHPDELRWISNYELSQLLTDLVHIFRTLDSIQNYEKFLIDYRITDENGKILIENEHNPTLRKILQSMFSLQDDVNALLRNETTLKLSPEKYRSNEAFMNAINALIKHIDHDKQELFPQFNDDPFTSEPPKRLFVMFTGNNYDCLYKTPQYYPYCVYDYCLHMLWYVIMHAE
jgi:hypothetical protein